MAIELYNGVILPDIPNEVLSQYPYVTICWVGDNHSGSSADYIFSATTSPQMYVDQIISGGSGSGRMVMVGCIGAGVQGKLKQVSSEWQEIDCDGVDGIVAAILAVEGTNKCGSLMWANHDVMHGIVSADQNSITSTGEKYEYEVSLADYNGDKLPVIPADILEQYPKTGIFKQVDSDLKTEYVLSLGTSDILYIPPEIRDSSNGIGGVLNTSTESSIYILSPLMNWEFFRTITPEFIMNVGSDENMQANVLWANHDIMVATKDADGNYIATDKIYDYIIDFIDYNGVLLPELPATDYSYAFIVDASSEALNGRGDGYILFLTNSKPVALLKAMTGEENDVVYIDGETSMYAYIENITNNWTNVDQQDYINIPINNQEYMMNLLWSKDDIMVAIDYNGILIETEQVYFPLQSEDTLPDIEYTSEYYVVPTSWISSIAKQTRRITGNYTRLTTEKIEEALENFGSYRKVFNKTIEEIDFELPKLIYPYSFAYCLALKSISSDNVLIVDNDAFMDCGKLHSVSFPNAISLGEYSFGGCGSLINVELPLVEEIGYGSFAECYNLVSIDLPNAVTVADSCFRNCDKLENVNIPKVEKARYSMFYNCISITKIDLPSVVSIGDTWNNYVFYGCKNLTAVILRSTTMVTALGDNNQQMFYDTPIANGTGYIYVPAALIDTYKADTVWSAYASQFRALEDYTIDGTITGELDESKI